MLSHYLVIAAGALTVTTTPVPASAPVVVPVDPQHMTIREIRAYNALLPRSDPAYIRCIHQEQIGSLVQTNYICHTNREWARLEDIANQNARDSIDAMSRKSTNDR
ncbi:MAG: hypothetical protein JSS36_10530 [Proteobacteria bacterium]|nr:hypothetical protein [Pseudomonadota bacterium]